MSTVERLIQCETRGSASWIWFDRDSKRNAWTPELVDMFTWALISADNDPSIRSVVVAAKGKCFCAGMDLSVSKNLDLPGYRAYYRKYENLRETIKWLSKPVIARVQGDGYGDGTAILECFDITVAAKAAKFGLREVNAGLSAGGLLFFELGRARALELCITGRSFTGAEAESWGLIARAVEPADLDATVQEYVDIFAELPPLAVAQTKRGANMVLGIAGQDAARKVTREVQIGTFESEDRKEAMQALLEKRKAVFSGR